MRSSIPRVRSVRYKDGRAPVLRVLRGHDPARDRAAAIRLIDETLATHGDREIVAMALVLWEPDFGATSVLATSPRFSAPTAMLPDLARTALNVHRIKSLVRDVIED